ncbi:MAG: type II toxin-antitoxin system PemK/MazF family toxin [bacterium]
MPPTTVKRGDVVLVEFVFSEKSGTKLRPALVISSDAYQRSRQEVIIAAITSNVSRKLLGDHVIAEWRAAGLLYPSTATGVLRTVKRAMLRRSLGTLKRADLDAYTRVLRECLGLEG